jgi:ATP-dependent Clp protease ATP-binding subunit ClpA
LRLVESGEARDSRGRRVDLRGYIFVVLHERDLDLRRGEIGFAGEGRPGRAPDGEEALLKGLERELSADWLGRVDRVIPFRPLTAEALAVLLQRRLTRLDEDVQRRWGVSLDVEAATCRAIAGDLGHEADARGFLRLVERQLIAPLLVELERNPDRASLRVVWEGGRAVFAPPRS